MSIVSKYASFMSQAPTTQVSDGKEYRTIVGNVFIQPTGVTKDGKDATGKKVKVKQPEASWKFHYVYLGFTDASGKTIAGFSIDTVKMLELIDLKVLNKSVGDAFEAYANRWAPQGKVILVGNN